MLSACVLFLRFCWQLSICMRSAQSHGAICLAALQCQQQAAPGQRASLGFSCQRLGSSAQTLAAASECMWHFCLCMWHGAAPRGSRRELLWKLFALQQLLLPCGCWIFYCSSKPYFTECCSRVAACVFDTKHPVKRVERQIPGEWLLNSAQRQSKTFC